jgi:hypothetical protein
MDGAAESIKIQREVNQGCPLSSLLCNICIESIFEYLKAFQMILQGRT